jgi:hypothetical protein
MVARVVRESQGSAAHKPTDGGAPEGILEDNLKGLCGL